jgi:HEAT repeat protein
MKRFLLAAFVFAAVLSVVFLVFFTVSKYRMDGQSYFQSLSDFVFMIRSYNAGAFGSGPPPLTERSYERVMSHSRDTAHSEVRRRVVWSLAQWGEDVVPVLLRELDDWKSSSRVVDSARALSELRAEVAAPRLEVALELARADRGLAVRLIDALAGMGPAAAPALVASYRGYLDRGENPPYNFLDAIGRSGGGADFLIAEMSRARTADEILALEWPLAFTRDPRAARILAGLLHHPALAVRRRARDSMAQSMGEVAIEPVLDVLENETDDYVRSFILQGILAGPEARSSERAVALLGKLLDDPVVAWDANYALARIGTERAIEVLHQRSAGKSPADVMDNLEYTGTLALRILDDFVRHEDPYVRRQAIEKLLSLGDSRALPLLLELVDDEDVPTRRYAREAVLAMDTVLLEESARSFLLEKTGRRFGRLRPPERDATTRLYTTLRFFHWVLLGVSFLVGALLLSGSLRAFEPYKLTLVLTFLLLLGIITDFLFLTEPGLYRFATAGRLLLLLGLLFLRDDPLPGETRGRSDRLAVRSLWVLVPLLLVFGVPILAEALRHALRDFGFLKWALLLALLLLFLVFEQAVVPWDLFPRGGRSERALALVLSSAVLGLFGTAVWRFMNEEAVAADRDRFFFGSLLLVPLLFAWVFHSRSSRLFARPAAGSVAVSTPPGRLRLVHDGEGLLIRLGRERGIGGFPRLLVGVLLLGGTWWLADRGGAANAGAPALILLTIAAIVAIALVWVVLAGFFGGIAIQIRGPAVRAATTFLGGAFGRPAWIRRPRVPVLLAGLPLERREKEWLTAAIRGSRRRTAALLAAALLGTVPLRAAIVAEDPSDYTRILESGAPALWNEAAEGLLGEKDELPLHAVSSVLRRFEELAPRIRLRVVRALRRHPQHPRTVETLERLARNGEGAIRSAAAESLFALRTEGAMDAFRDLILEETTYEAQAFESLVASFEAVSPQTFDERYLPAMRTLLRSKDAAVRRVAMKVSMRVETVGLRDEWSFALTDEDTSIREAAHWHLAETGDPRPCPALLERAWSSRGDPELVGRVGRACAPSSFLDYVRSYQEAPNEEGRAFHRSLIENALSPELLEDDATVTSLRELARSDDPFLRETVAAFLDSWEEKARSEERATALREGALPLFLVLSAVSAALVGTLLFIWAFRLWTLSARVQNRPVSRAASVASGPVALEGEAQPAGSFLKHPVTGEPCLYYVGADAAHPDARFYLKDESGRVLIDPRRAVLFSEDGVVVAGERVHVVGFASGRSPVVIGKDDARRPLYARAVHSLVSALFGFGQATSVTKMLFSDPRHCFWIWDDLERSPMGERRDQFWLALSVLLGGAWILVFAVAVLGLLDREMSEPLVRAVETFSGSSRLP